MLCEQCKLFSIAASKKIHFYSNLKKLVSSRVFISQVTTGNQNVLAICQLVVLACEEVAAVSRHFSTSVGAIQIQRGLLYLFTWRAESAMCTRSGSESGSSQPSDHVILCLMDGSDMHERGNERWILSQCLFGWENRRWSGKSDFKTAALQQQQIRSKAISYSRLKALVQIGKKVGKLQHESRTWF